MTVPSGPRKGQEIAGVERKIIGSKPLPEPIPVFMPPVPSVLEPPFPALPTLIPPVGGKPSPRQTR